MAIRRYRTFGPTKLVSATFTSNPTLISQVSATKTLVLTELKYGNISGANIHVELLNSTTTLEFQNAPVNGGVIWEPPGGVWAGRGPIRGRLEKTGSEVYVSGMYEIVKTS